MRITDITTTSFTQPMAPMHRRRFKGEQEIVLVRVITDGGLEGYAMARAHGGTTGRVISESIWGAWFPLAIGRTASQTTLQLTRLVEYRITPQPLLHN